MRLKKQLVANNDEPYDKCDRNNTVKDGFYVSLLASES